MGRGEEARTYLGDNDDDDNSMAAAWLVYLSG